VVYMKKRVAIKLLEDRYWKMAELKVKLRCTQWDDLVDIIYEVFSNMDENELRKLSTERISLEQVI